MFIPDFLFSSNSSSISIMDALSQGQEHFYIERSSVSLFILSSDKKEYVAANNELWQGHDYLICIHPGAKAYTSQWSSNALLFVYVHDDCVRIHMDRNDLAMLRNNSRQSDYLQLELFIECDELCVETMTMLNPRGKHSIRQRK